MYLVFRKYLKLIKVCFCTNILLSFLFTNLPQMHSNMVTQPLLLPVSPVSMVTENPTKLLQVSSVRQEEMKISTDEVNKILSDVQLMKGKQETIDSRIIAMKQ